MYQTTLELACLCYRRANYCSQSLANDDLGTMADHPPLIEIFTRGLSWRGFTVDWRSNHAAKIEFGRPLSTQSDKTKAVNERTGVTIQRVQTFLEDDESGPLGDGWVTASIEKIGIFAVQQGKVVGILLRRSARVKFGEFEISFFFLACVFLLCSGWTFTYSWRLVDTGCPGILVPHDMAERWYRNAYDQDEYVRLEDQYFVRCSATPRIQFAVVFRDAVLVLNDRWMKQYIKDSATTGCMFLSFLCTC